MEMKHDSMGEGERAGEWTARPAAGAESAMAEVTTAEAASERAHVTSSNRMDSSGARLNHIQSPDKDSMSASLPTPCLRKVIEGVGLEVQRVQLVGTKEWRDVGDVVEGDIQLAQRLERADAF